MQLHWITNKVDKQTAEILLYGYIGPYDDVSALSFVKELRTLEKECSQINLRINSGGGSVFEGLAIYNAIIQSPATITTYIDGLAASMASIIMLAGNKVLMSKSARIMTHQPSVGSFGNSEEHKKNASLLEGLEKTMLAIYCAKTGKSEADCKSIFLNGKDNWFDHKAAKENNLIDGVYDGAAIEVAASAMNEKNVWEQYNHKFAAKFIQTNNDMTKNYLSMTALAALNLTDKVEDSAIDTAIGDLVAKAAKVDTLTAQLNDVTAARDTAVTELATFKKDTVKADVIKMVDAAVNETRCTKEAGEQFKTLFAEKPTELKALLATMQPYTPIVKNITDETVNSVEVAELIKMTGEQLFMTGKLERLKELSVANYKIKYKEYFEQDAPADEAK